MNLLALSTSRSKVAGKVWRFAKIALPALLLLFTFSRGALGQQTPAGSDDTLELIKQLRKQVADLEARTKDLESKLGKAAPATAVPAEKVDALAKRVESLESAGKEQSTAIGDLQTKAAEVSEQVGKRSVQAFDGLKLDFGGFVSTNFTMGTGRKSARASFNATEMELLLRAKLAENWSLFTVMDFGFRSPLNVANPGRPQYEGFGEDVAVEIAWANYRHSDALEFQFGRFVTPHGISGPVRFAPALLDPNQPQFLRPEGGSTIFPNFLNGAQVHGRFFRGSDVLQYNAYVAVGAAKPDSLITGGRVGYTFGSSGLTLGGNYSHGHRTEGEDEPANLSIAGENSLTTNSYNTAGVDLRYDKGKLLVENEAFYSFERGQHRRMAAYTQPAWRINERWTGFYRFDYLDPGQGLGKSIENATGINFKPTPNVRFRAEYLIKRLQGPARTPGVFQLGASFSF